MARYVIIAVVVLGLLVVLSQMGKQIVYSAPIYFPGERVPDFTTVNVNGKTVRLSAYRGKVVLLNFFANWCSPCHDEAPQLEKDFYQKYRQRGFQIIGLYESTEGVAEAKAFRDTHKLTYPLWEKPRTGNATKKMKPPTLPWNILISRKGVVVYSATGFDPASLKKQVERLLDQPL
jgi:peroxiredoxin